TYTRTREEKYKALIDDVVKLVSTQEALQVAVRPILINAESPDEAAILEKRIRAALADHHLGDLLAIVDGRNEARDAWVIARMGRPGAITVAAQVVSRGHDIKIPDGSQAGQPNLYAPVDIADFGRIGGLVVLNTHHAPMERLEIQVQMRAGRQGRLGVYKVYDHLVDNEFLDTYAHDYADTLLHVSGETINPRGFKAVVEIARERRAAQVAARQDWLEDRYRNLSLAHGQFVELSRAMIRGGQEPRRFFNVAAAILHRANIAIQLGDDAAYMEQLEKLQEENRYMASVVKDPSLRFASGFPVSTRLRLLRETAGIGLADISAQADVGEGSYTELEHGLRPPKRKTLNKLAEVYVARGYARPAVLRDLGQSEPAEVLDAAAGRARGEVIRLLRRSRWLNQEEFGALLQPIATGNMIRDWELGLHSPNEEQLRQIARAFAERYGFNLARTLAVLGVQSKDEILTDLEGMTWAGIFRGLRGDRTWQQVADGVGDVKKGTVHLWETGDRPREATMRRIIEYYAREGFDRVRVRRLFGFLPPAEVEAQFADQTPYQIMELARKSIPVSQGEWAELLAYSKGALGKWGRGQAVPVKAIRKAASVLAEHGFNESVFLRACGVPDFADALAALADQPMSGIINGIRNLTGEEPNEIYGVIGVDLRTWESWVGEGVRPARPFRVRLAAHWSISWHMPAATLRRLFQVPTPEEVLEAAQGHYPAEILEMLMRPYDHTRASLARRTGTSPVTLERFAAGLAVQEPVLIKIADYYHDHHRFPRESLLELLRSANGHHAPGAQPVDPAPGVADDTNGGHPDDGVSTPAPNDDPLGLLALWRGLYRRVAAADAARGTAWRVAAFVAVAGALEDLEHRRLAVLHANSFIDDPTRL
ncbi:MAG: helix-turn-helix domain-containing protein, partial [Elusimicrobia bacterium]|nr:helix-turn-helix domain-containing protein [Elusimicrobiota bacterium]